MRHPSTLHFCDIGRSVVQHSGRPQSQKEKQDRDVSNRQENLYVLAGHLALHLDRIVTALSALSTNPEMNAGRIKNRFQDWLLKIVYPALTLLTRGFLNDQVPAQGFRDNVFFSKLSVICFSVVRVPTVDESPL